MKFKKGTRVEVFSNKDVPSGCWRCAEIVSGNGHNFVVRYDGYEMVLERVSSKEIRPCPPLPEIANNWVSGDVVEVLDCFSWKMATISKVLDKKHHLVRLLGSSLEFKVNKFDIRARQSWQEGKWIVIGKGSVSCDDREHNESLTMKNNRNSRKHVQMCNRKINVHARDGCFSEIKKAKFLNKPSCKILKRGHYDHLQVEVYDGAACKLRAIEKEGGQHRVFVSNHSMVPEQVVSSHAEKAGGIPTHASDNQIRLPQLEAKRRKSDDAVGCSLAVDLEARTADSVTCSVGSCSINSYDSYKLHHHSRFIEDIDSNCSDAESFYRGEYEEESSSQPTKEELAAEIHRLELYAYRCTMEALHASGPLSWEQESMVTNLRLSLHISNDEHLMEVRNLISADNSIPSR
ncbi:hypothetical protein Tsubulata_025539 [Turnera subulata]|uniref:ENT domain-containing protein n=1 Tax=Turnera subulata TaxID=218843 RepID=A0A9Q0F9X0_9ROSI|nr:hypothetical protein Tsubulata_025539 [Turnera subulata]